MKLDERRGAGAGGPLRGGGREGGPVKIGDGRRAGCHRRGLLNRLVRGRTEPPICTCARVINGPRSGRRGDSREGLVWGRERRADCGAFDLTSQVT
ncbi:unnamed protein product, partial [Iphiclides podalirius]